MAVALMYKRALSGSKSYRLLFQVPGKEDLVALIGLMDLSENILESLYMNPINAVIHLMTLRYTQGITVSVSTYEAIRQELRIRNTETQSFSNSPLFFNDR
jgi:hypothetical protein